MPRSIRAVTPFLALCFTFSFAASAQIGAPQPAQNPLAVGMQALQHEQWQDAEKFFSDYLGENPSSTEAQYYLGFAYFGERSYAKAEQVFLKMITADPKAWTAHLSLAEVYAGEERWADFENERKLIHDARERGDARPNKDGADVIDVLYVGGERYIVKEFEPLSGRWHLRYNIYHLDKEGKADYWIQCESDDVDQSFFAQKHPKEAAAGQRSFSLDSYTAIVKAGDRLTQTHGTIKFYPDGEPTYETVRADVVSVLQHRTGPISSTTGTLQQGQPGSPANATPAPAQPPKQ